jgi:hypothetical protein
LKYIEAEETKVVPRVEITQRLRALIDTCLRRRISHIEQVSRFEVTDQRGLVMFDTFSTHLKNYEQALMLAMIITTPSAYMRGSLRNRLRVELPYRMVIREHVY